jgi:hypothetical protein
MTKQAKPVSIWGGSWGLGVGETISDNDTGIISDKGLIFS